MKVYIVSLSTGDKNPQLIFYKKFDIIFIENEKGAKQMPNLNEQRPPHYRKDRVALWKRQRIQEGVCDYDAWNLDGWMLRVIPAGLRKLARNSHSYPGNEQFPTFKSWQEWLLETADMADRIIELQNAPWQNIEVHRQQDKEANQLKNKFFDRIKEQFFHLWD